MRAHKDRAIKVLTHSLKKHLHEVFEQEQSLNLLINSSIKGQANAGSFATQACNDHNAETLLNNPVLEKVSIVSCTKAEECFAEESGVFDFTLVLQQLLLPIPVKTKEEDWFKEASQETTLKFNTKGEGSEENDAKGGLLNKNAQGNNFKGSNLRGGDAQGGYLMEIYHEECADLSIYLPYVSYTADVSKIKEIRIGNVSCVKMEESNILICSCPFCFIASKKQHGGDFKQSGWHRGKMFDPKRGGLGAWHKKQIQNLVSSGKTDWDQKTAHMCWFLHTERVCLEQIMRHLKYGYHHDSNFANNLSDILHFCVCEVGRRLTSCGTDWSQWFDGPESDTLREYVCTVFTSWDDGSNLLYEMELETAYTNLCNQECDRIQVLLRDYLDDPRAILAPNGGLADVEGLLAEVNKVRSKLRECLLELQTSDDEESEVMFQSCRTSCT
jgi:hypothetical protein